MDKVLVTGGCGYIGSHTLVDLIESGHQVVSVDNLINSADHVLKAIEKITGVLVENHRIDVCDLASLQDLCAQHDFDGIIHFAALKNVGESVSEPLLYHRNNLVGMMNLLEVQKQFGIRNFIFSSSCTVYGNPSTLPVTEEAPFMPAESPYGRTKQICEGLIEDMSTAHPDFRYVNLRYFNPAGAHPSGLMGESPEGTAMNLVPIITETAIGKRTSFSVFGTDYDTRDGSCIRDYIYVMDLARAHTLSYVHASRSPLAKNLDAFNLGTGRGTTVLEAIAAFEEVSGIKLTYEKSGRRSGDVVSIYANYDKAKELLGWQPGSSIEEIMRTAWQWEKNRSQVGTA
ncbi:MAG: UDP-glucose 4-epimerase GalE [Saprospiraceae bacterium]|nr:UDP-glucose 4-epimerase GalE [Saprospiraceae bacterium]